MKKAFSLLLSIIFLMVMGIIGVMVMEFSSYNSTQVTSSFLDTRASLALRSATEYAILALQGHNFKNGLLKEINLSYPLFRANIKYHYFLIGCNGNEDCTEITTQDTNGTVLVYVTVESKNPSFHIRKVRVTLQNP